MASAQTAKPVASDADADRGPTGPSSGGTVDEGRAPMRDVWSWTGPKYRVRAVILLCVNILLFAGLGCFAFWLRKGHFFPPTFDGYWAELAQTFSPARDTAITPRSLLEFPINVVQVPMQAIILGLLLAALVSIPVLVTIYYRFPASLPFIAIVAFIAVMPWLAVTVTVSCILAAATRLRFSFRYASALLGLGPVILYLIFASLQTSPAVEAMPNPADHIKYLAPWVFAILASCVLFAIVLSLGRLVNARPGVIAPLLATMFVTPVLLFEYHVGRDELHYRLLESSWREAFTDRDMQSEFDADAQARWEAGAVPRPRYETVREHLGLLWQSVLEGDLNKGRSAHVGVQLFIVTRADWFTKHFPGSRYAVNAYYIRASTLATRIDATAFSEQKKLNHYDNFPSLDSHHAWQMVVANRPDSPMAAVALLRLAQLEARAGRLDDAVALLKRQQETRFGPQGEGATSSSATDQRRLFAIKPPESTLQIHLDWILLEGKQLLELIENNRDPLYGPAPFCGVDMPSGESKLGLLELDPGDLNYERNLRTLLEQYPQAQLSDNVHLILAQREDDPQRRVTLLEECLMRYPQGDSASEALYRLGLTLQEIDRASEADVAYERVIREFPDALWVEPATQRRRELSTTPIPPPAGTP